MLYRWPEKCSGIHAVTGSSRAQAESRIERDPHGLPIRLYPFTRPGDLDQPRAVVIDPRVSFGRPVLAGTGIATAVIAERYKAGESTAELAQDYGREQAEIEEAIRCERKLEAA